MMKTNQGSRSKTKNASVPGTKGSDNKTASSCGSTDWNKMEIHFKNPDFQHSFKSASKNKKIWKNLKQIVALELQQQKQQEEVTEETPKKEFHVSYGQIDAPPTFKPSKKYSDISGLEANYTDPQTKLNFSTSEEYKVIKKLPSDLIAGYLSLRRANILLQ